MAESTVAPMAFQQFTEAHFAQSGQGDNPAKLRELADAKKSAVRRIKKACRTPQELIYWHQLVHHTDFRAWSQP